MRDWLGAAVLLGTIALLYVLCGLLIPWEGP